MHIVHQLCAYTECSLEDLPDAMDNRDGGQEREREREREKERERERTPCYSLRPEDDGNEGDIYMFNMCEYAWDRDIEWNGDR